MEVVDRIAGHGVTLRSIFKLLHIFQLRIVSARGPLYDACIDTEASVSILHVQQIPTANQIHETA